MGANRKAQGLEWDFASTRYQSPYCMLQDWNYLNLKVLAQANILSLSNPLKNLTNKCNLFYPATSAMRIELGDEVSKASSSKINQSTSNDCNYHTPGLAKNTKALAPIWALKLDELGAVVW